MKESMDPNLQYDLPEVELPDLVLQLKKDKKLMEIVTLYLNLIRIRVSSFLKAISHEIPSDMTASDILSVFSTVLKQEIGISVLDTKLDQVIAIEESLTAPKKPTQKLLNTHICYIMDLYYQLHDFDPRFLKKDYRMRITKTMHKQENLTPLAKNLKYMQPLVRFVTEFKKSNTLLRKLNPFQFSTASIPKSVTPILKEYVESKFNEEVATVQSENENIMKMIEKTLELQEMKQSLVGAFDIASLAIPESELLRRRSMKRYLMLSGGFMLSIGGLFLSQIFFFPQAWKLFVMFGSIPITLFGFCIYIISRL